MARSLPRFARPMLQDEDYVQTKQIILFDITLASIFTLFKAEPRKSPEIRRRVPVEALSLCKTLSEPYLGEKTEEAESRPTSAATALRCVPPPSKDREREGQRPAVNCECTDFF